MIDEFAKSNLHGRLRRDHEVLLWKLDGLSEYDALALDAPGRVPRWPEPFSDTNLFAVLTHVLGETDRHAGHADILREGLDGRTGMRGWLMRGRGWLAGGGEVERAARAAAAIEASE